MLQACPDLNLNSAIIVNCSSAPTLVAEHKVMASVTVVLRIADVVVLIANAMPGPFLKQTNQRLDISYRRQDSSASSQVLQLTHVVRNAPEFSTNSLHSFEMGRGNSF